LVGAFVENPLFFP